MDFLGQFMSQVFTRGQKLVFQFEGMKNPLSLLVKDLEGIFCKNVKIILYFHSISGSVSTVYGIVYFKTPVNTDNSWS